MTSDTLTTSGAISASGLITASAGLTGTTLTASGLITANAGVDMKSQSITNLATPSASTDGATKGYIDTLDGQNVKLTGNQTIAGTKEFSGKLATSLGIPCIVGRNSKGTGATGGLELYGTSGNMNGPHIQAFVNTSVYPVFQQLNFAQDNIALSFDCYWDGSNWKSSNRNSNFQIYKISNKLSFLYATGVAVGGTITLAEAINISNAGTITTTGAITANGGISTTTATASGLLTATGGSKIAIQNSTDGGSSKGIFMWNSGDTNWGIYMATNGNYTALNNGTAPTGYGFSSHALRFRVNDSSTLMVLYGRIVLIIL